jgi:DNA replication and repair protein RecF
MRVQRLCITDLRCIKSLGLEPGPGLNVVLGPNGAGKTSVLEGLYVLSRGHSFRRRARDGLIRRESEGFTVRAEVSAGREGPRAIALRRTRGGWEGRLDGAELARLGDLFAGFAACAFTPNSHELLEGGAEERRAFWDWGVFHVEQAFLDEWRRYGRAMRQRNTLLREAAPDSLLEPFESEMARAGERIADWRSVYLSRLGPRTRARAQELLPELGPCSVLESPGFRREDFGGLANVLASRRAADRIRGTTTVGPHRADWSVRFGDHLEAAQLSRGQQKLTALALVLAQADVFAEARGHWPVLLLDDLASELDDPHQEALLRALEETGLQVILTGTGWTPPLALRRERAKVFHVEQGRRVDPDERG